MYEKERRLFFNDVFICKDYTKWVAHEVFVRNISADILGEESPMR
jgi:hypothetical protein